MTAKFLLEKHIYCAKCFLLQEWKEIMYSEMWREKQPHKCLFSLKQQEKNRSKSLSNLQASNKMEECLSHLTYLFECHWLRLHTTRTVEHKELRNF